MPHASPPVYRVPRRNLPIQKPAPVAAGALRNTPTQWIIHRMHYMTFLLLILSVTLPAFAQSPSATLAPTGTLRAVFLGSNPVHGRVDGSTGVATGVVPDLVKELARKLGVPNTVTP